MQGNSERQEHENSDTPYGLIETLSQISPSAIKAECHHILEADQVIFSDRPNVLTFLYARAILAKLKQIKHTYCRGCMHVDQWGHKGHPSQRRHECLMSPEWEMLEAGFMTCYMMVNRDQIAKDFLNLF